MGQKLILFLILALYLGIAALYAIKTPDWQVPDEPAHYNYIRQVAEERHLPVLRSGDYDQAYLEHVKSTGFPAELSLDRVEYEDWQPPLYYLLAAPVYLLFDGELLPLRLFSTIIGAGVVLLAYAVAATVFRRPSVVPLGTAAFVAFLPQHVAMMAGVNNDSLAELLGGAALWMVLGWMLHRPDPINRGASFWLAGLGVVVGLGMVTKASFLPVALAVGLAIVAVWWRAGNRTAGELSRLLLLVFVPALLIALPWWLRNATTYGGLDIYGMANHDAVVVGQPRTCEWIGDYGLGAWSERWAVFTFQSFWGQFGWMGVLMPTWLYRALALWSAALLVGLLYRLRVGDKDSDIPRSPLLLLGLFLLLVVLVYVYYNLTFVQHQGRYLFPALISIGVAAALGTEGLLRLVGWPERLRPPAFAVPFVAMLALDVYALWRIILPALSSA